MTFKVQVVTVTESGEEVVREVACVERQELTPASLGLERVLKIMLGSVPTAAASAALETQRRIDGARRLLRGDVTAHRRGERGCERRPERWRQARPDYILVVVRRASRSKAGRAHDDDARGIDARKP